MTAVKSTLSCKGQVAWVTDRKSCAHVVSIMRHSLHPKPKVLLVSNPPKAKQQLPRQPGGNVYEGQGRTVRTEPWTWNPGFSPVTFAPVLSLTGARAHLASEHSCLQLAQEQEKHPAEAAPRGGVCGSSPRSSAHPSGGTLVTPTISSSVRSCHSILPAEAGLWHSGLSQCLLGGSGTQNTSSEESSASKHFGCSLFPAFKKTQQGAHVLLSLSCPT